MVTTIEQERQEQQQQLDSIEHLPGPWSVDRSCGVNTVTIRDANEKVVAVIPTGNECGDGHIGTFAQCQGNIAIIAAALDAAIVFEDVGKDVSQCVELFGKLAQMAMD
jgi:hypothetical protein